MFERRILQNAKQICNLLNIDTNSYNEKPWTYNICMKIKNIEMILIQVKLLKEIGQSYRRIRSIGIYIRREFYNKFENYTFGSDKEIEIDKRNYLNLLTSENEQTLNWRHKRLHELNDIIQKNVDEGIRNLKTCKNRNVKINLKFLEEFEFESNIKKHIREKVISDIEKIKINATECQLGILHLCRQARPIDCHSLNAALSIFAVDLFLTSIEVDGFDHLLGKWPIYIFKNFEVEED
uniref:Uncharacterized protein n=1 Tax=Meloidogyne hapla TaxID=6305 RepID=A0A1I8B8Y5_MELHA